MADRTPVESASEHVSHQLRWMQHYDSGRLHFVPSRPESPTDEELWDNGSHGVVTTACNRTMDLVMPGLFSRLGAPRCRHCCRAIGLEDGDGTPGNHAWAKREENKSDGE